MFDPKIKIDKNLYEKIRKCAEAAGYASVDEFVNHILEKATKSLESEVMDEEAVMRQLQGLGYLE